MPSKTPAVFLTLNKASGSKFLKVHKRLKLTNALSQGFFCEKQASTAKYQYGRVEILGYLQLETNGRYRVNLMNKGYQTRLWNNAFEEVHTTSLAPQTSMTLTLSGKESLGKKLMVSAGQGPYLNHSNCFSWWKYPWAEVAQNTLFLKQEPPERGENLQWFTWRWESGNYHSQVQLYRCNTDQSVFTIRKFWVLCELWVVSLDRPEPGHTPVKQAEETNRFNFHFFNTQLG